MYQLNHDTLKGIFEHETINIDGKPYLTRYFVSGKNKRVSGEGPAVFLHFFHTSDQSRELHNHPYTGTSYILQGGYWEERCYGVGQANEDGFYKKYSQITRDWFGPGSVNVLMLNEFHRTELPAGSPGCWTLFITGERVQNWGFLNRDSYKFFPYMDASEQRQGRGPHSRDEIDTSVAVRRSEESVECPDRSWREDEANDVAELQTHFQAGDVVEVADVDNTYGAARGKYSVLRVVDVPGDGLELHGRILELYKGESNYLQVGDIQVFLAADAKLMHEYETTTSTQLFGGRSARREPGPVDIISVGDTVRYKSPLANQTSYDMRLGEVIKIDTSRLQGDMVLVRLTNGRNVAAETWRFSKV